MSMESAVQSSCLACGFNGTVLIAKDDNIMFLESFGYKNIKQKVALENNSIFRIGSITKQFTAAAILQLVESGACNLTDSIAQYIDHVPYPQKITIHQLLSNCSGVPNFNPFDDYSEYLMSEDFHRNMIENVVFSHPLTFEPGTRFEYSAGGYLILTYLIERLTKQSYSEYMNKHIFFPLEMKHTGFSFRDTILPEMASLYDVKNEEIVEAVDIDMRIASGGGGLYSCIEDLYKWNRALIRCQVLSSPYKDLMFSVHTQINERGGYGYGVFSVLIKERGYTHRIVYHSGNGPGVYGQNNIIDDNIQLIMLSNINDGNTFNHCFNQIIAIVRHTLL